MRSWQGSKRRAGLAGGGRRLRSAAALAALALALGLPPQIAAGQPRSGEDWPCVQRKVPSLSPASMWPGLSEEALTADWSADREVAELVEEIAPRRVSVEDGQEAIEAFAEGLGEAEKEEKLRLLFVGLFQSLDAERSEVMRGIERFAGNQAQLADEILADRAALEERRQEPGADPQEIAEGQEELTAAIRVFEDRRGTLTHVCEVPRVIEQRLFSFARTIQGALS